jgi:diguanylate cyclase (GGDEF)-like protein
VDLPLPRDDEHPVAPEREVEWVAAARMERRLQAVQVAIVVLLSLAVVAVAALTGRGMVSELSEYRAEQLRQTQLNDLRFLLQEQQSVMWRHRGQGGLGIPADVIRNVVRVNAGVRALAGVKAPRNASPAERAAIADTIAGLDAAVGVVLGAGDIGAPGSDADRRFLARLDPVADELREAARRWSAANAVELAEANADVVAATRRIVILTGLTALLATIVGLLTWRLVGRARRSIVGALVSAQERLRHLAATDPLTGLANQRLLHGRLRALADATRDGAPLSAVMVDLDHFKEVNDTHGHPAGDQVLMEAARRVAAALRPGDIVARIGGEEFLALLPDTDGPAALGVAERVRAALAEADHPGVGRVTASLGVATLSDGGDPDALLVRADAALYWAKSHGRDGAVLFSSVMAAMSPHNRARQIARADGLAAVRALARAIDAKDPATQRHSTRVADMAVMIATALGWSTEQCARLHEAGLVHDVGKIGSPDAILLAPRRLTPDEVAVMREHAALSARIVADVLDPDQVEWVAHHHERWDGRGYPEGIAGTAIPEGARILALADSWDAMTSARDYHEPRSGAEALRECRDRAGTQFWPPAVAALERLNGAGALPDGLAAVPVTA